MVVKPISATDVLRMSRDSLLVSPSEGINSTLLAALLRRAAGILCPCSPRTLVNFVADGLPNLGLDQASLIGRMEPLAQLMIVYGDLLELNQVTVDDPDVKGTWLFLAPPSFVVRPNGHVFLMGGASDDPSPLPSFLRQKVTTEGVTRSLRSDSSPNLALTLNELGLLELSHDVWLRSPRRTSPEELLASMTKRLMASPRSGDVEDLSILDLTRPVKYYRGRWVRPAKQSGTFVARRPQEFGKPLWGFAELELGHVVRFLDLPLPSSPWRGCDDAWHLQMAIDSELKTPQRYQCRSTERGVYLDFYSPLPLWAQRRLLILGESAPAEHCLSSFLIPAESLAVEEAFLQKHLWLAQTELVARGGQA